VTVYLVGAGPGDPGLITARGLDLLRRAEVVVYDRLAGEALLDEAASGALLVNAGKRPGAPVMTQDEINACLVEHGAAGKLVVRLKGGDPFVFGRGGEEALALAAAGVPFEVVPGVTSAIAAAAYAGVPVTHRGLAAQFAVITGHEEPGKETSEVDWDVLARFGGTLVFLMGIGRLQLIASSLIDAGKDPATPCVVIASGALPAQRSVRAPLEGIAAAVEREGVRPPAVTLVGPVAGLREQLAWVEGRPLHGRTICVTRARAQASTLVARLRELGAGVVEAPTIRIEPLPGDRIDARCYDLVCVTSPNAPRLLLDRIGGDARALAGARVAAIGPGTAAALRGVGLVPDVVAERFVAEGLLEAVGSDLAGRRALVARAEEARDTLPDGLRAAGAEVDVVALYRTLRVGPRDPARLLVCDVVAFSSSSTVRGFAEALHGHDLSGVRAVSIGPITTATARELGLQVVAEATQHDIDGLVEAIVGVLAREP
jgi:uroporphyrinogen III methyltransferase/synthase